MRPKDIWFEEMERIYNEKLDAGMPDALAYEQAGDEAHQATTDRLAIAADHARQIKKEGGQ